MRSGACVGIAALLNPYTTLKELDWFCGAMRTIAQNSLPMA
jgi:hypothetical protein